jgi:hypothetical protein
MLELLIVLGSIFLVGAIVIGVLKLLVWLLVLPIKLGFWIVKGVLGLIFLIPAVIIAAWAVSSVLPFVFAVIVIPVLFVVLAVVALFTLVF